MFLWGLIHRILDGDKAPGVAAVVISSTSVKTKHLKALV